MIINPYVYVSAVPGPNTISGLQLWLEADTIPGPPANDAEISTWPDDSGNARDVTGVVGATKKPRFKSTSGPNSKPAVSLRQISDGQGGYFTVPNFMSAYTSGHAFVVLKKDEDPTANSDCPPLDWGTQTDLYFPYTGNQHIYEGWGTDARKDDITPGTSLAAWLLYETRTASGAWSDWINGTQIFTTASNTVAFTTTPTIGFINATSRVFRGMVAEVIFYNKVLSAGEITTIKTYITAKYGLTLA